MEAILSAGIGYLLGSLSPAAVVSKLKKKDIRKSGTKNLGASNVMLHFGNFFGALVMVFDILKTVIAYKIATVLFPSLKYAGLIAGAFSVVGHVFPFYMKFKGGKGLAAFGGLVLSYSPLMFIVLLLACSALVLIVNYSFIMPISAGIIFPIWAALRAKSVKVFLILMPVGLLVVCKHWENLIKAKNGTDIKIREYIKEKVIKR